MFKNFSTLFIKLRLLCRDETSMMNIDEILETVENSDKNDEFLNPFNKPESFATKSKISNSFIEDYDK